MSSCKHVFWEHSKKCKYCGVDYDDFQKTHVVPYQEIRELITLKRDLRNHFCPERLIKLYIQIEKLEKHFEGFEKYLRNITIEVCKHEINPVKQQCIFCGLDAAMFHKYKDKT